MPESTESIPQTRNQNKTTYMKLAHCLIALALALFAAPFLQAQIPIKVVVVTTFENGDDITGNGEFQAWAANLPLPIVIHFPQGYHHLRYNPDLGVLGIVTGQGKSHAAISIRCTRTSGTRLHFRQVIICTRSSATSLQVVYGTFLMTV